MDSNIQGHTALILPQDLTAYYKSPSEGPVLIDGDGEEEALVLPRSSTYTTIVVFAAAFDPLSTTELADFSSAVDDFKTLDCELVGLTRDSSVAIKEWMREVGIVKLTKKLPGNVLTFLPQVGGCQVPVASAQGLEAGGLVQSLGVPLVNGYPLPAVLVTDKEDKVRYFATFQPGVKRSVEETLRVVAAVKEVDDANGKLFTPANWVQGEPTMTNSKTGVVQFYKERHGEGEPEEDEKEGRMAALQAKLKEFYDGVFGPSDTKEDGEARKKLETKVGCDEEYCGNFLHL